MRVRVRVRVCVRMRVRLYVHLRVSVCSRKWPLLKWRALTKLGAGGARGHATVSDRLDDGIRAWACGQTGAREKEGLECGLLLTHTHTQEHTHKSTHTNTHTHTQVHMFTNAMQLTSALCKAEVVVGTEVDAVPRASCCLEGPAVVVCLALDKRHGCAGHATDGAVEAVADTAVHVAGEKGLKPAIQ